jgi:outer membrane protein assembly factor BamE (lipoprotein component of BamABCDE complex)
MDASQTNRKPGASPCPIMNEPFYGLTQNFVFLGFCLCLCGCAWNHYTEGTVFDASDTNQIVKGKTTTTDLMNMFGTPYSKTPEAGGGEQWFYFCSHNLDVAGFVPVGSIAVEQTTKKQQNLTVLINKDKVVMDYRIDKGPIVKTTSAMSGYLFPVPPIDLGTQTTTNSKPEGVSPKP